MQLDPASEEPSGLVSELARASVHVRREERRRRIKRGLVASVLTLAACTLAAEVVLRISGDRRRALEASVGETNARWLGLARSGIFESVSDPVRRYRMRPGAAAEVEGWTFRVSEHATRGPDFPLAKPAKERRLLCIGDSFAFGMWCDEDETLGAQIVRLANEREAERGSDLRWRHLNIGVPGYHSGQQALAFEEEGLRLDPDLVVLYFNTNDIEHEGFFLDDRLGILRRDFLPLPTRLRRALWSVSHLYGWIARKHARMAESGPAPHLDPRVPYAHVRADNQESTQAALERIARACMERGLPLVWVHQPLMTYQGDARNPDWPVLPLVAWAEELRSELGLPGVSLLGWMRGYADGVVRMAEGAPVEFVHDFYFADRRIERAVAEARKEASRRGLVWEELDLEGRLACFGAMDPPDPPPDFHLGGEGYAHIARIVYASMQRDGIVP